MYSINLTLFNALFGLSHHGAALDFIIVCLAEYLPYAVIAAVLIMLYQSWCHGKTKNAVGYVLAFTSAAIARGITEIIRLFYHHLRPPALLHIVPLFPETGYSFPSGHAIFFFALAAGVYLVNKKFGRLLYGAAILIGIARIMAGVHWPFDILAGAILGIMTSYLIFWMIGFHKSQTGN